MLLRVPPSDSGRRHPVRCWCSSVDTLTSDRHARRRDIHQPHGAGAHRPTRRAALVACQRRLETADAWIAEQLRRNATGMALILAIMPAGTDAPVGTVGLFGLAEIAGPRLGYWVVRGHRNCGLASEAAALLVAWACANGHAGVMLEAEPHNDASHAVARRLGGSLRDRHTVRLDDGRTVELDRYIPGGMNLRRGRCLAGARRFWPPSVPMPLRPGRFSSCLKATAAFEVSALIPRGACTEPWGDVARPGAAPGRAQRP